MIAQHIGAIIYATAGSDAKRRFIMDKYGIPEDHIFTSQSTGFKDAIMRLTKHKGIDVILNSLTGIAAQDSWQCIAEFGTFVEIGKLDIYQKAQVDMEPFDRNATFTSVDLVALARSRPGKLREIFAKTMALFENSIFRTVQPITTMAMTDIEGAFRLLQSRKHIGKVVLEAREDTTVKILSSKSVSLRLNEAGTYVVAGGLGSIGQEMCRILASQGATHVLILSRSSPDPETRRRITKDLASLGTKTNIVACDICDMGKLKDVVQWCQKSLPPIRGVIQAAMVLQDRVLERIGLEDFSTVIQPKVHGTINLMHALERHALEFFVILSSNSSILGTEAQGSYAAASVFQDSLAQSSSNPRTPCLSLNLGMIDDTETIAAHPERQLNLLKTGEIPLKLKQVIPLLKYSMSAQAWRDRCKQIVVGFNRNSILKQQRFRLLQNPIFSHLPQDSLNGEPRKHASRSRTLAAAIAEATDIDAVHRIVTEATTTQLSTLVAIDVEKITLDSPMGNLGIDSLIAIELKNWTSQTLQAAVQTSEIFQAGSLRAFLATAMQRSKLVAAFQGRSSSGGDGQANGEAPMFEDLAGSVTPVAAP